MNGIRVSEQKHSIEESQRSGAAFFAFLATAKGLGGQSSSIPHLAKNERDVGHPSVGADGEEKRQSFDGASARLYQPTYAGANVGHPDRVGGRGGVEDHAPFHPPWAGELHASSLATPGRDNQVKAPTSLFPLRFSPVCRHAASHPTAISLSALRSHISIMIVLMENPIQNAIPKNCFGSR